MWIQRIVTQITITNSLSKLQPECGAWGGSIEVYENVTVNSHPVTIPFDCYNHLYEKSNIPKLEPIKLSKVNINDLSIAELKLIHDSDQLDKTVNEPFIKEHYCS